MSIHTRRHATVIAVLAVVAGLAGCGKSPTSPSPTVTRPPSVVPTTFRVAGAVTASGVGLQGATVTVVAGTGQGTAAITDFYGHYDLDGVAGGVEVRVTKDDYLDSTGRFSVNADTTYAFQMEAARPRAEDYTGTYTLTLTAGNTNGACTNGFPEPAKRRVYTAAIGQTGSDLSVSLTGADFIVTSDGHGNHFSGAVTPTGEIAFWISPPSPWDFAESDVVERLSDGARLSVEATIAARRTPTGISGTINPGAGGSIKVGADFCTIDRFELLRQ